MGLKRTAKRYAVAEGVDLQDWKNRCWSRVILEKVRKRESATVAEIASEIKAEGPDLRRPNTRESVEDLTAWYVNDLKKRGALREVQ
jgi:hypothetical protein